MILRVCALMCVASIVAGQSLSSIARPVNQNQDKLNTGATRSDIVCIASTYNPLRPGYRSGGRETASGEPYGDPGRLQGSNSRASRGCISLS
jgi:rare lipoprotein A